MPVDSKQINERMIVTNQLESWIKNGLRDNKSIIVIGDFNADPEKLDKIINSNSNKKLEDKYKIILSLRSLGMFDSQTSINQGYNQTWKGPLIDNKQAESRIDHIWITRNLIQDRLELIQYVTNFLIQTML